MFLGWQIRYCWTWLPNLKIMVSNIYLNNVGKYLKNYQGTFSCNGIKKPNFKNGISTYIFNLSKLNEAGTHLVAIQIN